jgi:hypothetical protein
MAKNGEQDVLDVPRVAEQRRGRHERRDEFQAEQCAERVPDRRAHEVRRHADGVGTGAYRSVHRSRARHADEQSDESVSGRPRQRDGEGGGTSDQTPASILSRAIYRVKAVSDGNEW